MIPYYRFCSDKSKVTVKPLLRIVDRKTIVKNSPLMLSAIIIKVTTESCRHYKRYYYRTLSHKPIKIAPCYKGERKNHSDTPPQCCSSRTIYCCYLESISISISGITIPSMVSLFIQSSHLVDQESGTNIIKITVLPPIFSLEDIPWRELFYFYSITNNNINTLYHFFFTSKRLIISITWSSFFCSQQIVIIINMASSYREMYYVVFNSYYNLYSAILDND